MEILLGTNAERTRNFSHGIFPMEKKLNSFRSELFANRVILVKENIYKIT
jgi:hypothetical protein